ncbi:cilia- and flagella-associated protein 74 [Trichomycterus rosablanca]|uniref:cilia- and flagella-associated protein 74 n=1 Tax=Trichomycterus rosablanca TaxID=2290929 RepID=UPI002F35BD80
MEESASEVFPEASDASPKAPQNTWTDEDTEDDEEDGTWDEVFNTEDSFPSEFFLNLEDPEWEKSKSGDMKLDERKMSNMDRSWKLKLRKGLNQLDSFYKQKELNVLKAREELNTCHHYITELEQQKNDLEIDIEKEKQVDNSAAVFRLRARHKCVCTELQATEELEAHLAMVVQEHELELCQVEIELGQFLNLRHQVEQDEKTLQIQKHEKYTQRIQREKNMAKNAKLKAQRDKREQETIEQKKAELDQRKQDQALINRKKAVVFLKQTLKRIHEKEEEREKKRKELIKKRMDAAASLKANISANQEALRLRQVKEKAQLQKLREDENHQMQSMHAAGMNSIKIFHTHKAQEGHNRKQEEFQERQKARRMEIRSKLLLEDTQKEREVKRQALHHPSSPPHVMQSMALKRQELWLLQSLLPPSAPPKRETIQERCLTHPASSPASSRSGSSSPDSMEELDQRACGLTVNEAAMDREGERECLVQPEFTGLWNRKHKDYKCRSDEDIPLQASLLRSMKASPDKPLTSKAVKKAPGVKEMKGPSFVSKPEIVMFKDFDLEKTYRKKVVLTNVLTSTNYCRFVEVSQNLVDFISISFEPPGPMSAGMACELEVVFKSLLNEDLDGEIQFQSATGYFSVIIKCRIKKCEMVVDSSLIDFGAHVVGQTISRVITLTNRGALGTRYSLTSLSSSHPQLYGLSQQSSPTKQGPVNSSNIKCAPLSNEETANRENTWGTTQTEVQSDQSPTGCDTSRDFEVSGADQVSGATDLEDSTGIEQDQGSEITEIKIEEKMLEGEVKPFASVKLPIIFTPKIPGETKLDIQISFSQSGCEPIIVSTRGVAESVPVWVTKPNVDLKICMYDRLYQDSIEVQSRASTALKLTFEVCKELKNHMDILPKTGFIQARSSFHAQLKFLPRCTLPEDAKSFFDQDTGVLEVLLNIQVADQVKPVPFTVHAVVTTSDLKFDCTEVDFGHCSVSESVRTSVHLTNCSLLPQDFGFVGIPKFIDIQPNDGFGTLLPLQTLKIDLIFNAFKAGEYNFQLTCKSAINRDFLLSCRAIGVRPLLELSDSLLQFGATAAGDCSTAVLYVLNSHTSRNEFTHPVPRIGKGPIAPVCAKYFTFIPPEKSEITVTPVTGCVFPGQRCLVQVTFSPALSDDDIKAEAVRLLCHNEEMKLQESQKAEVLDNCNKRIGSETKSKKETEQDSKNPPQKRTSKVSQTHKTESTSQPPNPADIQKDSDEYAAGKASLLQSFKERCSRYVIPCFVSNGDIREQKETEAPIYSLHNTLYLELHCPAVQPMLMVVSDKGKTTINFNQVAVGQKVLKKVTIQNISSELVDLKSSLLDLNGPFCVQNAMRAVKPGDTHTLLLAFIPAMCKKYHETLEVMCSKMALEFTLCGEGVEPLVTCSHKGQLLDFGYVLEKESTTQVFQLQNSSSLHVQFKVLLDSICLPTHNHFQLLPAFLSTYSTPCSTLGTQNYSGQSVFSVSPTEGAIAPGKHQDVTVSFQPDHESMKYHDTLRVQLMNQQTVCVLELQGAARCHNMFVCGGDPLDMCNESLIPPHIYNTETTESTEREKPSSPVLVTLKSMYHEGREMAAVRKLDVGCIRTSQPAIKKGGEFSWENMAVLQQHGINVDPTKGNVDAGQRRTITISWTPPAGHNPSEVIQVCVPLILKGVETEVYNVTLLAYTSHHTHSG